MDFEDIEIYSEEIVDFSFLVKHQNTIEIKNKTTELIMSIFFGRVGRMGRDHLLAESLGKKEDLRISRFDFSNDFHQFCDLIQSCIDHKFLRLTFSQCKFPFLSKDNLKEIQFKTPNDKQRPLYSLEFDNCSFTAENE